MTIEEIIRSPSQMKNCVAMRNKLAEHGAEITLDQVVANVVMSYTHLIDKIRSVTHTEMPDDELLGMIFLLQSIVGAAAGNKIEELAKLMSEETDRSYEGATDDIPSGF